MSAGTFEATHMTAVVLKDYDGTPRSLTVADLPIPPLRPGEPDQISDALLPLVAPHMFLRTIGLSFLVPGVVSPSLPAAFAVPAAYGDFVAGILAVAATLALAKRASWAIVLVWVFNVWGAGDLLNAIYQGNVRAKLDPGMFVATFYIPTAVVPPLLVTHALIFWLLLRPKTL